SQENGTCATIWPLWKAALENMKTSNYTKSFDTMPELQLDDIILTAEENQLHGGECFKKFKKDLEKSQPTTSQKVEVHKMPLHPLPAMDIEGATILSNGEVVQAIFNKLRVDTSESTTAFDTIKIFTGDQLSVARLQALVNIQAGQEGGYPGFGWGIWMPGLFHAKIADMHGLLYVESATWDTLIANVNTILGHFASTEVVAKLWDERLCHDPEEHGDMIFENTVLFLRDTLISREFMDAIKSGDSGCNPNSWVEVDLVQEHLNFWIKKFYKHEPMDLTQDTPILMLSLKDHGVYDMQPGRVFEDPEDKPIVDSMTTGLQSLTNSSTNPLVEYNKAFQYLQAHHRMQPLVSTRYLPKLTIPSPPSLPLVQQTDASISTTQSGPLTSDSDTMVFMQSSEGEGSGSLVHIGEDNVAEGNFGEEDSVCKDDEDDSSNRSEDNKDEDDQTNTFNLKTEFLLQASPFDPTLTCSDEGDVSFDMDLDMGVGDGWLGIHVDEGFESDDDNFTDE
ncbi:hypothetical protein JAAARDRAFT_45877, partial [Jaapia argillacea MUCL 33604]